MVDIMIEKNEFTDDVKPSTEKKYLRDLKMSFKTARLVLREMEKGIS